VNCEAAREAISAMLDGEPPTVARLNSPERARAQLESHLSTCAACRAWRERAHEVTRRTRLAAARPVPSPDPSLLAAMRAIDRRDPWWRTLMLTRVALVLVALAQLTLALPELLAGSYREAPIHVAHEMGALDVALGVGFLVAAWRPLRAQGMRAIVGCAALLLALTAVVDLLAGRTDLGDETPHLLVLAGWLLLWRTTTLMPSGEQDERLGRPRLARPSLRALRTLAAPGLQPVREPPLAPATPLPRRSEPGRSERRAAQLAAELAVEDGRQRLAESG
jgi:predicted anti-sigma-YlaC factor YlaD